MAKYTWKQGDNLFDLAKKYNTTSSAILEANPGLTQPLAGVVLTIPGVTTLAGDPRGPGEITPRPGVSTTPVLDPRGPGEITPRPGVSTTPPVLDPRGPGEITPRPGVTVPPIVQQPVLPALEPSRVGLPTLPSLEPSRVGQVPQAPPPSLAVQPGTPQATVVNYLNRLFNIQPGVFREQQQAPPLEPSRVGGGPSYWQQFLRSSPFDPAGYRALGLALNQTGQNVNRAFGLYGQPQLAARAPGLEPSRVGGVPSPTTYSQLIAQGMDPNEAARVIAANLSQYGPPTTGPPGGPIFPMGEGGWPDIGGPEPIRTSLLDWYLDQGVMPLVIFREDIARHGWTEAELIRWGYRKDQFGDWIRIPPDETEMVAAEGGAGGRAYYPRRAGVGGGQPRAGGGGGAGYGYGGGRGIEINFPEGTQSFVQRTQRGVSPTGRNMRPARMGAVSWRI